jgi:hydrogenase expression/formation protein HypD
VAGFEPLDILASVVKLLELVRDRRAEVVNLFPRCVNREGNERAKALLWRAFRLTGGRWRGIADIPDGNLRLRDELSAHDARKVHRIDLGPALAGAGGSAADCCALGARCICGDIMAGVATPHDCPLFGKECQPETPVGACMVSSEGACKIWHMYGGRPDLREVKS